MLAQWVFNSTHQNYHTYNLNGNCFSIQSFYDLLLMSSPITLKSRTWRRFMLHCSRYIHRRVMQWELWNNNNKKKHWSSIIKLSINWTVKWITIWPHIVLFISLFVIRGQRWKSWIGSERLLKWMLIREKGEPSKRERVTLKQLHISMSILNLNVKHTCKSWAHENGLLSGVESEDECANESSLRETSN